MNSSDAYLWVEIDLDLVGNGCHSRRSEITVDLVVPKRCNSAFSEIQLCFRTQRESITRVQV